MTVNLRYKHVTPRAVGLNAACLWDLLCSQAAECEGIKIFHFNSSIYFANSDLYVSALKEKTGLYPEQLQVARKAQKKLKAKANSIQKSQLTAHVDDNERGVVHEVLSYDHAAEEQRNGRPGDGHSQTDSEATVFLEPLCSVRFIILDWTPASFIDSVGAKVVKQVIKEYAAVDVHVVIAGCSRNLMSELDTLQFFTGFMSPKMMFPTVHDAVLHCQHSSNSRRTNQ